MNEVTFERRAIFDNSGFLLGLSKNDRFSVSDSPRFKKNDFEFLSEQPT